jgi:hypothetical protein
MLVRSVKFRGGRVCVAAGCMKQGQMSARKLERGTNELSSANCGDERIEGAGRSVHSKGREECAEKKRKIREKERGAFWNCFNKEPRAELT